MSSLHIEFVNRIGQLDEFTAETLKSSPGNQNKEKEKCIRLSIDLIRTRTGAELSPFF